MYQCKSVLQALAPKRVNSDCKIQWFENSWGSGSRLPWTSARDLAKQGIRTAVTGLAALVTTHESLFGEADSMVQLPVAVVRAVRPVAPDPCSCPEENM